MTTETGRATTFEVVNPATRAVVGVHPVHGADEVRAAVAAAREAQRWWQELGAPGRKPFLRRWIRHLALQCDELYEVGHAETARPRPDVQFELFAGLEDVRWAATHAGRVLRVRRWNLPDTIPMLRGSGFRALVTDPAPSAVVARTSSYCALIPSGRKRPSSSTARLARQ